jgi:hypothetical protein
VAAWSAAVIELLGRGQGFLAANGIDGYALRDLRFPPFPSRVSDEVSKVPAREPCHSEVL